MSADRVQSLMQEVGPLADLHAVGAFEGHDVWTLVVDEETAIDADLDPARGCLVLSAELGAPPASDRARWLELLLQYNYQWAETGGVRMAVATSGGPFVLLVDHPVADLAAGDLAQRVRHFVGLLQAWRDILTRAPTGVRGADEGDSVTGPESLIGMIRA
jgi:hypothetical protein